MIDYGTKRLSGENSNPPKYFGNNKINNNSQRNINLHKLKLRDNNYNKNKDEKKDGKHKSEIFDVFGSNKNRDMNLYKESEKNLVNDINNDEKEQEKNIDNNNKKKKIKVRRK